MLLIEPNVGPDWGETEKWRTHSENAVRAAIQASTFSALIAQKTMVEISIKFSNDEEVRALNKSYRNKDKATNVLSFPLVQPDLLPSLSNVDDGEILLGDVILAHGTCAHEATEKGISFVDHATHLVVHGTLHLLGYDHENEADALVMESLEAKALAALHIDNPYLDEVAGRAS